MRLETGDYSKSVDIGSAAIWNSLCSTIEIRLKKELKKFPNVMQFITTRECPSDKALQTAREFNLVRDALSQVSPDKAVYDKNDLKKKAPWEGNISPIITSCANMYTTADGADLLCEVVSIFSYAAYAKVAVTIE